MTVPTTQDYSQSGLSSLLANAVDATQLHQILNLDNLGAVAETDTGGPYSPLPDVQDTNNNDPSLLLLDNSGNTINLNDFPNLDTVILAGNNSGLHLVGLGNEVTVYSDGSGNTIDGQACSTNNIEINLGNGSHDTVFGSLSIMQDWNILGSTGGNDLIDMKNLEYSQVVGRGAGDTIMMGNGQSNTVIDKFDHTTIYAGAGQSETIVAHGNNDTINGLGNADNQVVYLGGNNNDTVNITVNTTGQITDLHMFGLNSTDTVHFAEPLSNVECIAVGKTNAEVDFADGQTVLMTGTHIAATFSGDPSIHYL